MKINILDADSLIFYVCHNKKDEPESTLDEIKDKLDKWLLDIFGKTYSTHYIMYLTEGKSFRSEVFKEYKANRVGREKPKYFNEVKQYLKDKYKAISYPGLEADDLYLISMYMNPIEFRDLIPTEALKGMSLEVFMCVLDKDLLNLEGEHYNYKSGEWKYTTQEEALYYFWGSMIIGDSGDGIIGLKGYGKKKVEEVFNEFTSNEYPFLVLKMYMEYYGEYLGIQEYHSTYKALKILDTHKEFEQNIGLPIEIEWK